MVATPWGNKDELKAQKLPPGPAMVAEEVAESQRRRLFGAMVASVAEKGYEGTGVADLSEISGVSPRSFYQLFEGKQDCFVATLGAVLSLFVARTMEAPRDEDWREEARTRMVAFASFVAEQPAAARLLLVEAHAAGPERSALNERGVIAIERQVREQMVEAGAPGAIPEEMTVAAVAAVIGGVRTRLVDGNTQQLPAFAEQLATFLLEFEPPVRPLRSAIRPPERREEEKEAGDHAERALRAFEALLVDHGFSELTMGQVAERAGMSVRTLYANFADREELMLAAVDSAAAQAVAAMLPAYRRRHNPAEGVRAAFSAFFGLLASRPNLAHTLLAAVREGGAPALARRSEVLRAIEPLLAAGIPAHLRPVSVRIASEAHLNAVLGLATRRLIESGAESLPGLAAISSYMVLAPVLGAEQASAAAEGKSYRRPPPEVAEALLHAGVRPIGNRLMTAVTQGQMTAEELAAAALLPLEGIEAQLPDLEAAGVIEPVPGGDPAGPARYQAASGQLSLEEWATLSQAEREAMSAEIGRVIEAEVEEAVEAGTFDARTDRSLARIPVWLDEEGWKELTRRVDASIDEVLAIQKRAGKRFMEEGNPRAGSFGRVLLASFEVPRREADAVE
jgi:AcrR family transcriptional regulator